MMIYTKNPILSKIMPIYLVHVVHITPSKHVHLRNPFKINTSREEVHEVHFNNSMQVHQLKV